MSAPYFCQAFGECALLLSSFLVSVPLLSGFLVSAPLLSGFLVSAPCFCQAFLVSAPSLSNGHGLGVHVSEGDVIEGVVIDAETVVFVVVDVGRESGSGC